MKQTVMTGKGIYEDIRALEIELKTIEETLEGVAAQMGSESKAYTLLQEKHTEIKEKLHNLYNTKYGFITTR